MNNSALYIPDLEDEIGHASCLERAIHPAIITIAIVTFVIAA